MNSNLLPLKILLYFVLNQIILSVASSNSPVNHHPLDNITVDCGSSGKSTAVDGRQWTGDVGSNYTPLLHGNNGKLIRSKPTDQPLSPRTVPFNTAQLSRWPFVYTFRVTPGQKLIRFHFYPASYQGGFKRSDAFFTVKAGPYTLLRNFSASLAVDALGLQYLVKEYCVNVEENQPLTITFTPTLGVSDKAYAFVNGIEIVSIPTGLYHTQGTHDVSQNFRFPIGESIALEMVQRLNIGGSSISSMEDTGMFRHWSHDSNSLMEKSNVQPVATTLRIKYTSIPSYTAPHKVYKTSWLMVTDKQGNSTFNFTWKLSIDLGFRYLIRLHFCDFEYETEESDRTKFSVFFNEHVAEAKADIIKLSGGNRVAVYRDYVVMMEGDTMMGKHDLLIAYFPHNDNWMEHIAILKGLEVFKLSNPDRNLAGVNPMPQAHALTSSTVNPKKFVYTSGGNTIATILVIFLTVLNVSVYNLRVWSDKVGPKNISPLQPEGLCRRFSLSDVLSVTKNFDDELILGSGGFGNVYKALIDDGSTTVAIKRLNSKSKQGADEFWTEIGMLSNLRHVHLVSLIGYCDERQEMILVYEYMENGTLADHLYKPGIVCPLSWEQRMKICIGAARGLDYLHTGTQCGVIHRDVKTTNILLDKDWVAKISDFGLCKLGSTCHSQTHVSTDVKGTFGYLDPEYFLAHRLTKKSDVYAFGDVLFEVLCGRPAVDIRLEEEQRSLALWSQQCIKEEKLDQLIDPILKDQISPQCLKVFTEVAYKCLHIHPNGRPTMTDVVTSLECILDSLKQPKNASTEEVEEEDINVQRDYNKQIYEMEEEDINVQRDFNQQIYEVEEEDINVHGDYNLQIYDGKETKQNEIIQGDTIAFPSTPVQFNENTKTQKRSKRNLFQRGIAFLARRRDISPMGIPDVEIQATATNELISQDESNSSGKTINTTTSSDESNSSGNWQFSAMSDTNKSYPERQILPTLHFRIFSFSELENATRNFGLDTLLGDGRFGRVYSGRLNEKVTSNNGSGFVVAVKRLDYERIHRFVDWKSEVVFLGGLSHSNLVKLLGHCWEDQKLFLVYEFMQNGSLEEHIFERGSAVQPLPWNIRLKILIGAARGLAFLHTLETPVICRGFKASNILLDGSYNSKISDFGFSTLDSPESPTVLYGYEPYVAPEYAATGHWDVRSDVYSFGVVLLEMLTGSRARDTKRLHWQRNLDDWVKPYLADRRKLASVIDSGLDGKYPPKAALLLAVLAQDCLQSCPKTRPSMKEVVETLEHINTSSEKPLEHHGITAYNVNSICQWNLHWN